VLGLLCKSKKETTTILCRLRETSLTEQNKRNISKAIKAVWASGVFHNISAKTPAIRYKGINMRSSWEARLANVFDTLSWEWEYEPCRFRYMLDDGYHTYTPDFYVPGFDCYFDPHFDIWTDEVPKFLAVRTQCGITLIVLNEELLEMYERFAGTTNSYVPEEKANPDYVQLELAW
jgi:hypothetical protein